jgi:soluble lytic murein transglycosylase-like protein
MIAASAATYMPEVDWLLWKAQVHTESAFRPNATSPVGAQGLAQVMPGTFRDIMRETNIRGNPYDPYTNLMAGAYYMGKMRRIFRAPRPDVERHKLAAASYNAGAGHIIRAQALVGNPKEWKPVADVLPQITGRHAKETQNYVERIFRTYQTYSYGLNN